MRIIDIPEYKNKKQLFTLEKETYIIDAVKKMQEWQCGSVVVTEGGKMCGIFTERDLLNKVVAADLELKGLQLKDVMTTNVQTAHFEDDVYASMERMTKGKFRHLPITDDSGQLVGMISQGDFNYITWHQLFNQLTNKTKASFFGFTQIWMLLLGMLGYSVLIYIIFSWAKK
jgi:CBS domain-containing protein